MANVPWQDVLDEFRQFRREMAQAHQDHQQRMGQHETELQALQVRHEQRMDAMQALITQQAARLDQHADRLAKAEDTLERITVIWERLNNPPTNGH